MSDITRGDVEGVRQDLLESDRLDDASAEYRAGWIDALIVMDLALTDPEAARDGPIFGGQRVSKGNRRER